MPSEPQLPPLHHVHVEAGAKLAEFAGWLMPLEYAGGGVLAEHAAVRSAAGLFDVSHLATLTLRGPGALELLDATLTASFRVGRAQYTLCCAEDGGVVDDLIAYPHAADDVTLIANAANGAEVAARLAAAAPAGVRLDSRHGGVVVLAVQGPASAAVLAAAGLPAELGYLRFDRAPWRDVEVLTARTGYTGEHGYELVAPATVGAALWDALREAGRAHGLRPAGLAARDTLRTEMGYPLHGQDLSREITPVQARLGWAVGWDKPAFWGRAALLAERERGADRLLTGLRAVGRGIPRPGMAVRTGDGRPLGRVTSGTFSPTLRTGIALALLEPGVADGDEVLVDVRGRAEPMRVQRPPFVAASPR